MRRARLVVAFTLAVLAGVALAVVTGTVTTVTYTCASGVTSYVIPFAYLSTSHVQATLDGSVLTTGYTISGQNFNYTCPTTGKTLVLTRVTPYDQPTNFRTQGGLQPVTVEKAIDRTVMQTQQLNDSVTGLSTKVGNLAASVAAGGGSGTPSTLGIISVAVTPPTAFLAPGANSSPFTANVVVSGAQAQTVAWTVTETGGGTVTPIGTSNQATYTAPAAPGTYHVVATSTVDITKYGVATVTVTPAAAPLTCASFSPVAGPTGALVTIAAGTSLASNSYVTFGANATGLAPLTLVSASTGQAVVPSTVPAGAVNVVLTSNGMSVTCPGTFNVTTAAYVGITATGATVTSGNQATATASVITNPSNDTTLSRAALWTMQNGPCTIASTTAATSAGVSTAVINTPSGLTAPTTLCTLKAATADSSLNTFATITITPGAGASTGTNVSYVYLYDATTTPRGSVQIQLDLKPVTASVFDVVWSTSASTATTPGAVGGSTQYGYVTAAGLYMAPATAGTYKVWAVSKDPNCATVVGNRCQDWCLVTVTTPTSTLAVTPVAATSATGAATVLTISGGTSPYTTTVTANKSGGALTGAGPYTWTAGSTGGSADVIQICDSAATKACVNATINVNAGSAVTTLAALPLGAFPGCQGAGCKSRGGFATGSVVYFVTSLASGTAAGTLGACIAASGPRVCLFKVSGTINGTYIIANAGITIEGRGAPGGGIQLARVGLGGGTATFDIRTTDVVIRGLRIRPGYDTNIPTYVPAAGDQSEKRSIRIYNDYSSVSNVVIDHNSFEYGNSHNWDVYARNTTPGYGSAPRDITFSWNMYGESLNSYTDPLPQSRAMVWACRDSASCAALSAGMTDVDLHHNFIASIGYRQPDFRGWRGRLVNNYVYNWGLHAFDISGTVNVDVIGNIFKLGPMRAAADPNRGAYVPIELNTTGNSSDYDWAVGQAPPLYYLYQNIDYRSQSDYTLDNWSSGIATGYGVTNAITYKRATPLATPVSGFAIVSTDPVTARGQVLAGAGASQRVDCGGAVVSGRDSVDARIVSYEATSGGPSLAPQTETDLGLPGIPTIVNVGSTTCTGRDNSACLCADADGDGLPDVFEAYWKTQLNLTDITPGGTDIAAPWTNLEAYLSGLAAVPGSSLGAGLMPFLSNSLLASSK